MNIYSFPVSKKFELFMTQEVASARRAATTIGRCMIRKVVELKSQLIYLYMASTIIIISLSPAQG